jgi:hypothetical protein
MLLSNELISLVAVPDIGGRLMSLRLGPHEYLFLNQELAGKTFTAEEHYGDGTLASWKNYGGEKTWPAPQGWGGETEWPGPPDPVLDSGRYGGEVFREDDSVGVTMVSPAEAATGLRIHRRVAIRPGASRVWLDLTLENVVERPIRWAPWDVAQLDCSLPLPGGGRGPNTDCWLYIPTDTSSGGERPYRILFGDDNPQWHHVVAPGLLGVRYWGLVGKIGVANTAGWLAFADQAAGYVLCTRFSVHPELEYPDGGSTVECWTEAPGAPVPASLTYRPVGYLLEAEVLGPLRTLGPGEQTTLGIEWGIARCPAPLLRVNAAGCSHDPLSVVVEGNWARVRGIFGCFDVGRADLVWLDGAERELQRSSLQMTSPLSVLSVDSAVALPERAAVARIEIRRPDGSLAGSLDDAAIG